MLVFCIVLTQFLWKWVEFERLWQNVISPNLNTIKPFEFNTNCVNKRFSALLKVMYLLRSSTKKFKLKLFHCWTVLHTIHIALNSTMCHSGWRKKIVLLWTTLSLNIKLFTSSLSLANERDKKEYTQQLSKEFKATYRTVIRCNQILFWMK